MKPDRAVARRAMVGGLGAGVSLLALAAGGVHAAPMARSLPIALAAKAAEAALSACTAQGYRVTVTIVDREGVTRAQLVGDGAGPVSISTSRRKAYTSAALGIPTSLMASQPAPPVSVDPDILPLAGGLPIVSGDQVVGAIGVGGADRSDKDEACAKAGLDSISEALK